VLAQLLCNFVTHGLCKSSFGQLKARILQPTQMPNQVFAHCNQQQRTWTMYSTRQASAVSTDNMWRRFAIIPRSGRQRRSGRNDTRYSLRQTERRASDKATLKWQRGWVWWRCCQLIHHRADETSHMAPLSSSLINDVTWLGLPPVAH